MAQYLPVLLVSVSAVSPNPAPDDSSLDTQAIGQVDYLSHEWQEEDVAKSWRNMTRRKDSIQNGLRLENASWRTWWKQRNNLPTVSPETLNWLKDSDVTWLYGPLHTAADWAPPPRHSPEPEVTASSLAPPCLPPSTLHPNLHSHSTRSNSRWSLKPILKHRSISELLSISLSASPVHDAMELDEDQNDVNSTSPNFAQQGKTLRETAVLDESRKRPKLTHTKSDSNMHQPNPFRRESPPLPLATRSRDSSTGDSALGTHSAHRGRHISFNTFVEQCIAIEKPKKVLYDEDSFDEHEEKYYENDEDSEDDDEESEDEVLEMRPTPRSRAYSSRHTPSLSGASASTWSSSPFDVPSPEREHVTIAPIAPTVLKTAASPSPVGSYQYGGIWDEDEVEDEDMVLARAHNVSLVYVPPQGSVYAERLSANATKTSPPKASTEPRSASLDDALLRGLESPADASPYAPFEANLELLRDHNACGDNSHFISCSDRSSARPRNSNADPEDEARSRSSMRSVSEDGTVVLAPPSAAIPVPHAQTRLSPSSTPSPIPSGVSSAGPMYLEPPSRGRSTSPILGRDRDPLRGRSLSRGSVDGSVSPRSGSHSRLGRKGSGGLGTSPTWRDKSPSPEENESGLRRPSKTSKRRDGGSVESSPPNVVRGKDDETISRPRAQTPNGVPEDGKGDDTNADMVLSNNPTPCNSPIVAFDPLVRPSPQEETNTLAGRAADIMSSARGYLGSFWGGGERHSAQLLDATDASISLRPR